jgi:hypothetical protein
MDFLWVMRFWSRDATAYSERADLIRAGLLSSQPTCAPEKVARLWYNGLFPVAHNTDAVRPFSDPFSPLGEG